MFHRFFCFLKRSLLTVLLVLLLLLLAAGGQPHPLCGLRPAAPDLRAGGDLH